MARDEARNVLVVVLDTVRASETYVGGQSITPTLERVAESGTDFRRAITPAPWTLPAHASMYTGLYPTEHGTGHGNRWLDDELPTLAERLREAGFSTGLFTANAFLTGGFNMDRGFAEVTFVKNRANKLFDDAFDPVEFLLTREHDSGVARLSEIGSAIAEGSVLKNVTNALYFKISDAYQSRAGTTEDPTWDDVAVAEAREFVERSSARNERFFGFVNLVDAHAPWRFDRALLDDVGVTPEDIAPDSRWEYAAAHSEAQWPYAAGEIEFDDTDRRILREMYRAHVHRVDRLVARLLDGLEEAGVANETLLVVTADHGECIARDGVLGHSVSVDEEVAHVPLAIDGPGVSSERVDSPVSLKDIYGTVLFGTGVDEDALTLFDEATRGRAYIETEGMDPDAVDEKYRTAAGSFGPRRALYTADGWVEYREATDESKGDTALLEELRSLSAAHEPRYGSAGGDVELDSDVEERLRDLGYRG